MRDLPGDPDYFKNFPALLLPNATVWTYTATTVVISATHIKMEDEVQLVEQNMDSWCLILPILDEDCKEYTDSCKNTNKKPSRLPFRIMYAHSTTFISSVTSNPDPM